MRMWSALTPTGMRWGFLPATLAWSCLWPVMCSIQMQLRALGDHSVDLVLIGSHAEAPRMARLREELEQRTGAVIAVGPVDAVDAWIDKDRTAQRLRAAGCHYARSIVSSSPRLSHQVVQLVEQIGFPLVVKPRSGQGSRGVGIVRTMDQLERATAALAAPLIQEYLGDEDSEYTTAVLADRAGTIAGTVTMRRQLVAGTTVVAEIGDHPEIAAECRRVIRALGLCGPGNVQMRMTERGPVTFEVNPRFSGTTAMRALAGWNDVAAVVGHYLHGEPMQVGPARPGRVTRFYDEVFVPADEVAEIAATGRWPGESRPERGSGIDSLSLFGPGRAR